MSSRSSSSSAASLSAFENINQLLTISSFRDSTGKILQNATKLAALRLKAAESGGDPEQIARFQTISKSIGTARRIFKLGKFMKHLEGYPKLEKKHSHLILLYQAELTARLVKDFVENVQTGTKFGFLRKNMFPQIDRFFSTCKLIQASLSLAVTVIEIREMTSAFKEHVRNSTSNEKTRAELAKTRRNLFLLHITAVKLVADFLTAGSELSLPGFPGDQLICVAGIVSGSVDTYKTGQKNWK